MKEFSVTLRSDEVIEAVGWSSTEVLDYLEVNDGIHRNDIKGIKCHGQTGASMVATVQGRMAMAA